MLLSDLGLQKSAGSPSVQRWTEGGMCVWQAQGDALDCRSIRSGYAAHAGRDDSSGDHPVSGVSLPLGAS
jgi:hypothetical protein